MTADANLFQVPEGPARAHPAADATALPKWLQVSEMIQREIASGRLTPGDRLPPEREMAADLGVAVGTLRKALAELQARGAIERRQGSGNYICEAPAGASVYAFFRLERLDGGGLPTARVLSVDRLPKPAHLPPFGTSTEAHRIRRMRALDGLIVAAEEIWLDGGYAAVIAAADLSELLYLHYRTRLGFWIAQADDRVGLAALPNWAAGLSGAPGTPCGHVTRIGRDQTGARAEISYTWFDHTRAAYVARLR